MGWGYWARVVLMICSFIAIVLTIEKLQNTGLQKKIQHSLGMDTTSQSLMWCRNRVAIVSFDGKKVLWQEGMDWKGPSKAALPQLAIEKWFGTSCRLVYSAAEGDFSGIKRKVEIEFLDGSKSAFLQNDKGLWQWESVTFASPMWDLQLVELEKLVLH